MESRVLDHPCRPAALSADGPAIHHHDVEGRSLAWSSANASAAGAPIGKRRPRRAGGSRRALRPQRPKPVPAGEGQIAEPRTGPSRCRFARSDTQWTLLGDCTATASIVLPPGISLDGNGKTISLAGDAERFESVAVHLREAAVRDLTIDGSGLAAACPSYFAALVVSGPASLENVTVQNVRFDEQCAAAAGIEVGIFDDAAVAMAGITVTNVDGVGMLMTGDGQVTVEGCAVRNATTGIQVMNTIEASITDVATENVGAGIVVSGRARARVQGSVMPDEMGSMSAMDNGQATLGNLTLAGFGSESRVRLPARALPPGALGLTPGSSSSSPRHTSGV